MKSKPVLDYKGLIKKIELSGVLLPDKSRALEILKQLNYQRLMVYRYHFIENGKLNKTTSIEDIFLLYNFDRELKFCIYPLLESFEMTFRSKVAYYLGNSTGTHGYLNPSNFRDQTNFHRWHQSFSKTMSRYKRKKHSLINNHQKRYKDDLPIYKAIELYSFGELTKYYDNINIPMVRSDVMHDYVQIESKLTYKIFYSWLVRLTDIRNICAHYDILYNRYFELKPLRKQNWKNLVLPFSKNNKYYSIYTILLILKILTIDEDLYYEVVVDLDNLFFKYSRIVKPTDLNFPKAWRQEIENQYI